MHDEELKSKLKTFGLTPSETSVYLHLLEKGMLTPPKIAVVTGITRTNTYNVLDGLKAKGLIREGNLGKRKTYEAKDPKALLEYLRTKQETLEGILPDLAALHHTSAKKPSIRFFEGFDEVKEIYLAITRAQDVRGLGSLGQLAGSDARFYTNFLKDLAMRKVLFKDILTHASAQEQAYQEAKTALGALYDVRVLPEKYPDFPIDALIWEDNVAIVSLEDPIFGTVIKNAAIAQMFRAITDILWLQAKRVP